MRIQTDMVITQTPKQNLIEQETGELHGVAWATGVIRDADIITSYQAEIRRGEQMPTIMPNYFLRNILSELWAHK